MVIVVGAIIAVLTVFMTKKLLEWEKEKEIKDAVEDEEIE